MASETEIGPECDDLVEVYAPNQVSQFRYCQSVLMCTAWNFGQDNPQRRR